MTLRPFLIVLFWVNEISVQDECSLLLDDVKSRCSLEYVLDRSDRLIAIGSLMILLTPELNVTI